MNQVTLPTFPISSHTHDCRSYAEFFGELPTDAIFKVLSYLNHRELSSIACISRKMFQSATETWDAIWEHLFCLRFAASFPYFQAQMSQRSLVRVESDSILNALQSSAWYGYYRQFAMGALSAHVQVYYRSMKQSVSYCMSYHDARIYHVPSSKTLTIVTDKGQMREGNDEWYVVHYIGVRNAEEGEVEFVPASRIRQAAPFLDPHLAWSKEGNLKVGDAVEVQWTRSLAQPFAWWFGYIEAIWEEKSSAEAKNGKAEAEKGINITENSLSFKRQYPAASPLLSKSSFTSIRKASIIFKHYKQESPWYRFTIEIGGRKKVSRCLGGYAGGIKLVPKINLKDWESKIPDYCIL